MACCGARERPEKIDKTKKWDYINLSDFRSNSCIPPLSYGILFISIIISIACYVIDIFTAAQLLIFNRWAGQVQPAIPLDISRWIFLACIVASWFFLVYRMWKARRAIKSHGIAQSYLDPLAVRLQSLRFGKEGRGWRRFLVFAEMSKHKKGADYVALFTYFSFEAWYRIVFAEGPRKVINAVTLYGVLNADLLKHGNPSQSTILQFFNNVKVLADGDHIRAAVLFGMLFVLIKWVFEAIGLLLSCLFYIFFLWHHIPSDYSGLRGYCKAKVDDRLSKIVDEKVTKAIKKADAKRTRTDLMSGKSGESIADIKKQPTLPTLEPSFGEMPPAMALSRQNTHGSMDSYAPDRQPTLPGLDTTPTPRSYMRRMDSAHSTSSNSPLMGDASPMGFAAPRSHSPAPFRPYTPGVSRSNTGTSAMSGASLAPPLSRQNTGFPHGRNSPAPGMRFNSAQEFEMRAQTPGGYINRGNTSSPFGYNQAAGAGGSMRSPVQRSFTSPVMGDPNYPLSRSFGSKTHGAPPRSQPRGGYDDSIYDHY